MSSACGKASKGIKVRPLNEFSKHSSRYSKGNNVRPLIKKAIEDDRRVEDDLYGVVNRVVAGSTECFMSKS